MNEASRIFKTFKVSLAMRLTAEGMTRNGDVFALKCNDCLIFFDIQRDIKANVKSLIRFTVNAGISVDVLRAGQNREIGTDAPVPEYHWRSRLGRLREPPEDTWWTIADEAGIGNLCDEIASMILDSAMPKLKAVASSETLLQLWREDTGPGLTEYERRRYQGLLLVAMGCKEEARLAADALEAAGTGKSWQVPARVEARHLRAMLA